MDDPLGYEPYKAPEYNDDYDTVATNISALAEHLDSKSKMSKGEKLFDLAIYGGIGGAAVFVGGLFLTYWSKYAGGEKLFQNAISNIEKRGVSKSTAETAVMTTALSMAGNLSIIPIKIAENHKAGAVKKINSLIGEDPDHEVTNKRAPQTWMSLIKGRILAIAAVFVSFKGAQAVIGSKKFEEYEDKFAEKIVCSPLNKPSHVGEKIAQNETRMFRYGKIAALDIYATIAATVLLYVGSRFFAKPKKTADNITPENHPIINDGLEAIRPEFEKTNYSGKFASKESAYTDRLIAAKEQPTDKAMALR